MVEYGGCGKKGLGLCGESRADMVTVTWIAMLVWKGLVIKVLVPKTFSFQFYLSVHFYLYS